MKIYKVSLRDKGRWFQLEVKILQCYFQHTGAFGSPSIKYPAMGSSQQCQWRRERFPANPYI